MKNQITSLALENKRLKDKVKMLTGWISLISHDSKEVFGSLNWIIDAYDNEIISKDDFFKMLPQIKKDANKNLQTSKDTSDWLRTQLGGFVPKQDSINAFDLFEQLKAEYKEALHKKELSFEFKDDASLTIVSDQILLLFILRKVLHNAIKYSYPNTNQSIYFQASKKGKESIISITDFGTGILENNLNSIYSFDNPVFEGTVGEIGAGLSLKVAQDFVFLLDGSIELNSSENKGTTVSIHLPNY